MIRFVIRRALFALGLIFSSPTFGDENSTNIGNQKPEVRDCADCPPLVAIPKLPGASNHLMIARHELTWAEYLQSVREAQCLLPPLPEGSNYPADLSKMADDYPFSRLAVSDFSCYLNWISKKTGHRYRLPTGPEWEFAARAGSDARFPWGNEPGFNNTAIDTWFDPNGLKRQPRFAFDPRERTGKDSSYFPVESFAPNAWGLYDVVGNLNEVTSDTKPGLSICIRNVGAKKCTTYAVRGGSADSIMFRLESTGRRIVGEDIEPFKDIKWYMGEFDQPLGFRIVREAHGGR